MKKNILTISFVLIVFFSIWTIFSKNENRAKDTQSTINSFYMDKPDNWQSQTASAVYDNVSNFELSDNEIGELMKAHNGAIPLAIYTKYKIEEHEGTIPTIQINLISNKSNDFTEFKQSFIQSFKEFEDYFDNLEYIDQPQEIEISGIKSVYIKTKFDMPLKDGQVINVRSWTYGIPKGSYFYQINFSDAFEKDDNSDLYENLIKSIKITALPSDSYN